MNPTLPCNCDSIIIPPYLHSKTRPKITYFDNSDSLLRRFEYLDTNHNPTLSDDKVSISIFSTKKMSCNIKSLCNQVDDVLYDITKDMFVEKAGIVSLAYSQLVLYQAIDPTDDSISYRLIVLHQPEPCMFPHAEIIVAKNNKLIDDFERPKSVKVAIKLFYRGNSEIIRKPIP